MQLKPCVESCTPLLPEVKFWLVHYVGSLNPEMNLGNLGSWLEGKARRSAGASLSAAPLEKWPIRKAGPSEAAPGSRGQATRSSCETKSL